MPPDRLATRTNDRRELVPYSIANPITNIIRIWIPFDFKDMYVFFHWSSSRTFWYSMLKAVDGIHKFPKELLAPPPPSTTSFSTSKYATTPCARACNSSSTRWGVKPRRVYTPAAKRKILKGTKFKRDATITCHRENWIADYTVCTIWTHKYVVSNADSIWGKPKGLNGEQACRRQYAFFCRHQSAKNGEEAGRPIVNLVFKTISRVI